MLVQPLDLEWDNMLVQLTESKLVKGKVFQLENLRELSLGLDLDGQW